MRHPGGAGPRRDHRLAGLLVTLAAVLLGGWWMDRPASAPRPATPGPAAADAALHQHFHQAVVLLHAGRHAEAVSALHQVLALAPRLSEAHVNMGFALLGLRRPEAARDCFESATTLAPGQANAYYGLAMAWEASGDLPMATGAMRSYLHLARAERPEHLARARAALWTWEQARQPAGAASSPASTPATATATATTAPPRAGRELATRSVMHAHTAQPGPGPLPDSGNRFPMPAMPGGRP